MKEIRNYRKRWRLSLQNAEIHYNLANTLRRQGKIDEAIEQYGLAITIQTDYAMRIIIWAMRFCRRANSTRQKPVLSLL